VALGGERDVSVTVEKLTKRFSAGGSPAIADIAFEAPSGAITSLIGPSGAGKSTVLRIVAGLESPDEGVVRIAGQDCSKVPVQERGVGLVFQNYALFQHMTVRDNVGFGLSVRGRPKKEVHARAEELLALVQLEGYGDRFPRQLSGGQRQRVAFARALAIEPKVLLLDEPFGALDARVRRELREWLHDLHEKTQTTTLLVTHDQEEALEISGHVVILLDGRLAQAGSPGDVYDRPVSPAVAEFLGANVLHNESELSYVRPHDVKIARASSEGSEGGEVRMGEVERIRMVGARAKVTLMLPGGDRVTVELGKEELETLHIAEGDQVLVDVGQARVFLGDYAI
jgi:sulfate/thiosulfate transport system ATP-binding protein